MTWIQLSTHSQNFVEISKTCFVRCWTLVFSLFHCSAILIVDINTIVKSWHFDHVSISLCLFIHQCLQLQRRSNVSAHILIDRCPTKGFNYPVIRKHVNHCSATSRTPKSPSKMSSILFKSAITPNRGSYSLRCTINCSWMTSTCWPFTAFRSTICRIST